MANRPTPHHGNGGGQAQPPYARVVRARGLRGRLAPINDNVEPPAKKLKRWAIIGAMVAVPVIAGLVYWGM